MNSQIVGKLKMQDPKEVLKLYKGETARKIKSFVLKHGGTKENAEDVLVDTIMRIMKLMKEGKYEEEGKFEAFFYRVGQWVWKEESRRSRKQRIKIVAEIDPNLTAELLDDELPHTLKKRIEYLSSSVRIQQFLKKHSRCRKIFELRFIDGYSLVDIEKYFGIKHVNVNCKRCIEKLREHLNSLERQND